MTEYQNKLRFFVVKLIERTKDWLHDFPYPTIQTWGELEEKFLEILSHHKILREKGRSFELGDVDSLYDARATFILLLLNKRSLHGMDEIDQMQIFTKRGEISYRESTSVRHMVP